MASIWTIHIHASSSFPLRTWSDELQCPTESGRDFVCTKRNRRIKRGRFVVAAVSSDGDMRHENDAVVVEKSRRDVVEKHQQNPVNKLQETISSIPLFTVATGKFTGMNITIGLCIVATMLIVVVRGYTARKSRNSRSGSLADLVRRGQLKSDRRGISTPLKYDDPFNNPMIKVGKNNSTVEMCGKVYRLAPVTLTGEQQTIHQKRRSRAYQWKRPTIFLREGESVPPDVDPDTVRWIPSNHPFATTSSDIDEDLAQNNVYQKNGVPFRIQAEHEALQRKLEALQNEQKLSKLMIDPAAARDFERPYKSSMKSENQIEHNTANSKLGSNPSASDRIQSSGNKPPSEETRNPQVS
ncbi:LOW QUALITY PROTEIN: protein MULTIPLE CHLOROPLAST DIVISION SITE 1-like [Primulina eburnea]|uniref:LOW QUALITY PROTEIN: protein MULTIPLE CHLOROPLAST DIVISION SITE 1-like n=1 Tax=Primulina eburnea TaxID=1245227 RepID=UPI003C6C3F0E